jgi:hypothetical protein
MHHSQNEPSSPEVDEDISLRRPVENIKSRHKNTHPDLLFRSIWGSYWCGLWSQRNWFATLYVLFIAQLDGLFVYLFWLKYSYLSIFLELRKNDFWKKIELFECDKTSYLYEESIKW